MSQLAPIIIRSPQANDIVDDPIQISGLAIAFEAVFNVRVRDQNGTIIVEKFYSDAGSGTWRNFQITVPLGNIPATSAGTVEVFAVSAKDGSEIDKVTIPVVFGPALVSPYIGFALYEVKAGDTLSKIANQFYGNSGLNNRIFEANRNQLLNPNQIFPGQCLRIPQ